MLLEVKALTLLLLLPCVAGLARCPAYTKFLPHHDHYHEHCESDAGHLGSDPKYPCFVMWTDSLYYANATLDNPKIAPKDFFWVKDGYMTGKWPFLAPLLSSCADDEVHPDPLCGRLYDFEPEGAVYVDLATWHRFHALLRLRREDWMQKNPAPTQVQQ